jgi:hypothetical protein
MSRVARRWRAPQQPPQVVINGGKMSSRQMKRLADQVALVMPQPAATTAGALPGAAKVNDALAATHAYRFRRQLIPAGWLAGLLAGVVPLHLAHAVAASVIVAVAAAAGTVLLTLHAGKPARRLAVVLAILTLTWLPLLTVTGTSRPWPAFLAACFTGTCWWWSHKNRRRPEPARRDKTPGGDVATWNALAGMQKWHAVLGEREDIPGGRRYPVICNGAKTDIGEIMTRGRKIAAAYDTSMTAAYAEKSPDGVESRGYLTLLERNTLETARLWDGRGVDPQTGVGILGRYADGQDMHVRIWARRDGTKHGLFAGDTGSGKSYALDLLLRVCIASGMVTPVILDPQEGQSLPQWQDAIPYAAGVDECMALLAKLNEAMLDRSRYLRRRPWTDEQGREHKVMNFYDPLIASELPVVLPIIDEAPVLLADRLVKDRAKFLLADMGKRGRKTGFSEWLVTQIPSLEELGSRTIRSMLTGGSVIALRTADKASKNMLSMDIDPADLPKAFPDGTPTYGLCLADTMDMRGAPARTDYVPQEKQDDLPAVRPLDDRMAGILNGWRDRFSVALPFTPAAPSPAPPLAAVAPADDSPEGRRAADAVLIVLTSEMDRPEIVRLVGELATGEWGRPKPFGVRAIADALRDLTDSGRIERTGKPGSGTYAPVRASLHAVPQAGHATTAEASR